MNNNLHILIYSEVHGRSILTLFLHLFLLKNNLELLLLVVDQGIVKVQLVFLSSQMQWSLVKFLLYKISYLFTKNKNKNSYAILLIITTTIVIYKNMFNIKPVSSNIFSDPSTEWIIWWWIGLSLKKLNLKIGITKSYFFFILKKKTNFFIYRGEKKRWCIAASEVF